jgi:hypothetical protein
MPQPACGMLRLSSPGREGLVSLTVRGHFDGKALIPDEPLHLPQDEPLWITIQEEAPQTSAAVPLLADANVPLEAKLESLRELLTFAVPGVNVPDEALRRENMYGDDGR